MQPFAVAAAPMEAGQVEVADVALPDIAPALDDDGEPGATKALDRGVVCFRRGDLFPSDRHEAGEEGASLHVRLQEATVTPRARGRLGELIDEAIERSLEARHAMPPGIGSSRDADAQLSDQLFRARQVGATRLRLSLPSLSALTGRGHALGSEDTDALVFWARATRERPVDLILARADRALSAHVDPTPLALALNDARDPPPVPPPSLATIPTAARAERSTEHGTGRALPTSSAGPKAGSLPPADVDPWRTATLALTAARGPQPLATLERLFANHYLPLDTALHDPSRPHDPRATHARDEFRDTFSRVYLEAFQSFALTGKRPKMILDAPETAARLARQTSARTSHLLLVDGMRYDVGLLMRDALSALLARRATLTHEVILWSAPPTTTTHQLATLARGVSALQGEPDEEREDGAIRGRTAQTIRRVKVGSRDVHRLDLCDTRVREAGDRVLVSLPSIASDVAATVAKHTLTLPPRTLLLVFGDHGFTLDKDGTPSSGGASPEEVLVPAFAFLTGEVH